MHVGKAILGSALLLVSACLCRAQQDLVPHGTVDLFSRNPSHLKFSDRHIDADEARELYRRSVFAHGYIHGYEDGFHLGDQDFQTGHLPRDLRHVKQFRNATGSYRDDLGGRESFREAYRQGFSAGYNDAISDRDFRAIAAARRAGEGLQDVLLDAARTTQTFDYGFREGYESGKVNGEVAGRDQTGYKPHPSACEAGSPPPAGLSLEFCDGYARGYGMGYDDGYQSAGQRSDINTTAKKR